MWNYLFFIRVVTEIIVKIIHWIEEWLLQANYFDSNLSGKNLV